MKIFAFQCILLIESLNENYTYFCLFKPVTTRKNVFNLGTDAVFLLGGGSDF